MLYQVIVAFCMFCFVFFFKQKTAYEMRISYWSSDVCSSDLLKLFLEERQGTPSHPGGRPDQQGQQEARRAEAGPMSPRDDDEKITKADLEDKFQIGRASSRERVCQSV